MSGHSKWSTIKHKKAAQDARRSKVFTKLIKEITVAAKLGGGDTDANPRLRAAVLNAKGNNMPMDTINRAIKKGTGGNDGVDFETVTYEGYGPNNVAIVVEALTDNRNRTIASVRTAFNKFNGTLGGPNTVLYMFDRKGVIDVEAGDVDEESMTDHVLEAGAEDLSVADGYYEVTCAVEDFDTVRNALEAQGLTIRASGLAHVPQARTLVDDKEQAEQVLGLLDMLEDDDDVQQVFTNFDMDDAVAAELDA